MKWIFSHPSLVSRYSFFTSVGIVIACIQLILLIVCCGCLKAEECLRVRSYTIDLLWAIAKEIPQIVIIFQLNLCRDGWFKMSSLFKAIFSILVTLWKLSNLSNFLRKDVKSDDIPNWCRAKRVYMCFPLFLVPVWLVNLALSVMIAILFIHRHHGEGHIQIAGSIHPLYVHDKYLYTKYLVRSGIYLRWPEHGEQHASYMKLAELDSVMANKKTTVHLVFQLPHVCFERSQADRRASQCFKYDNQTRRLTSLSPQQFRLDAQQASRNASFTFRYKPPSNKNTLGQITYEGAETGSPLFLDHLLYFRLHHGMTQESDNDFFHRTLSADYEFYTVHQQLIPVEQAWRYGLGKCQPCVLGPQLVRN